MLLLDSLKAGKEEDQTIERVGGRLDKGGKDMMGKLHNLTIAML